MPKIGAMLIGGSGAIASALITGLHILNNELQDNQSAGMLTADSEFDELDLVSPKDIVFAGWDFFPSDPVNVCINNHILTEFSNIKNSLDTASIEIYEGILTKTDYLHSEGIAKQRVISYTKAIDKIRKDIHSFRQKNNIDYIVIVNVSSPHKNIQIHDWHHNEGSFLAHVNTDDIDITSSMLYCLAGIYEDCSFVEFTPSSTLEPDAIKILASKNNIALAGRDGSTGQTLLKYVLGPMFKTRNLKVNSWYSTNILGNNDGKILSNENYSGSKMHDKSHGLNMNLKYLVEQVIDIKYLSTKHDNKESWDSIEFSGWLNEKMSVRINWNGKDSILAAPLIIDLIRLQAYNMINGFSGLQTQLGVYFKNPAGTNEREYFKLYNTLISFYNQKEIN